jgi:hypothetical protein
MVYYEKKFLDILVIYLILFLKMYKIFSLLFSVDLFIKQRYLSIKLYIAIVSPDETR